MAWCTSLALRASNKTHFSAEEIRQALFQLLVLGFGLLQDGNVGVGIFPECEEILVGRQCSDLSTE